MARGYGPITGTAMAAKYMVRLLFEWGGGCLWCGNDAARQAFGVGSIEDKLPLSEALRHHLVDMSAWHDRSLNWEYPRDPGPWSAEEYEQFAQAANEVLTVIRIELGEDFEVVYEPLGQLVLRGF
jgi:hypothetical protein